MESTMKIDHRKNKRIITYVQKERKQAKWKTGQKEVRGPRSLIRSICAPRVDLHGTRSSFWTCFSAGYFAGLSFKVAIRLLIKPN